MSVAEDSQNKRLRVDPALEQGMPSQSSTERKPTSSVGNSSSLDAPSEEQQTTDSPWFTGNSSVDSLPRTWGEKIRTYHRSYQRRWNYTPFGHQYLENASWQRTASRSDSRWLDFSIGTYNVLSQDLLRNNMHLYQSCLEEHLEWEYRKENLLYELSIMQPDVLCLQEMHQSHYYKDILPHLQKLGYAGLYKKRTGLDQMDGCAILLKTSVFELVQEVPIEYYHPGASNLDRDNIGLVVVLRVHKAAHKNLVCIGNTHILFNPKRGDVKLAQLMVLLSTLEKVSHVSTRHRWPILLCGDLNLQPYSDLYRFLDHGTLTYDRLVIQYMAGQDTYYSADKYLGKMLIPQSVGITDHCQFVDELQQRLSKKLQKKSQKSISGSASISQPGPSVTNKNITNMASKNDNLKCTSEEVIVINDSDNEQAEPYISSSQETSEPASESDGMFDQGTGTVYHHLNLSSVYRHVKTHRNRNYPEVTSHHDRANCTLDYIFYSVKRREVMNNSFTRILQEGRLHCIGQLELPSSKEAENVYGCLPNKYISSDHFLLVSRFLYRLKS